MSGAERVELFRATICHTPANPFAGAAGMAAFADGAIAVAGGRIAMCGDYAAVRAAYPRAPAVDWRGGYILPGFVDAHVHFPQLRILGTLGRPLLPWLNDVALPEEARMADPGHAAAIAPRFVGQLLAHGTTTAMVFGAHFAPATATLFDVAETAGLRLVSGLVVSDRLLHHGLHVTPRDAYDAGADLIRRYHGHGRLLYAVTPRFALSTSEAMLEACQSLLTDHPEIRVQTHINENPQEVAAVARQFPWATDYLEVYERFGLVGRQSVFAHSVWSTAGELERLAAASASVAHCPCSNAALGSGLFRFGRHLASGVRVALGTDVGGGTGFGLLKEGLQAYMLQRLMPDGVELSAARLLYLATGAGAEALGLDQETGDFRPGKAADFVYLRPPADSPLAAVLERVQSIEEAVSAIVTLAGAESVREVRIAGGVVHRAVQP